MEILTVEFNDSAVLDINDETVIIRPMKDNHNDAVNIRIHAPKSIPVNREEVHKALKKKAALKKAQEKTK